MRPASRAPTLAPSIAYDPVIFVAADVRPPSKATSVATSIVYLLEAERPQERSRRLVARRHGYSGPASTDGLHLLWPGRGRRAARLATAYEQAAGWRQGASLLVACYPARVERFLPFIISKCPRAALHDLARATGLAGKAGPFSSEVLASAIFARTS
jgi:hypothetical protein